MADFDTIVSIISCVVAIIIFVLVFRCFYKYFATRKSSSSSSSHNRTHPHDETSQLYPVMQPENQTGYDYSACPPTVYPPSNPIEPQAPINYTQAYTPQYGQYDIAEDLPGPAQE